MVCVARGICNARTTSWNLSKHTTKLRREMKQKRWMEMRRKVAEEGMKEGKEEGRQEVRKYKR